MEQIIIIGLALVTTVLTTLAGIVIKRLFGKMEQIHILVNSRMGEAQAEITTLKTEVQSLKETISVLATGKAASGVGIISTAIITPPVDPPPEPEGA